MYVLQRLLLPAKEMWRALGLETDRSNLAAIRSALEVVEYILKATEQRKLRWSLGYGIYGWRETWSGRREEDGAPKPWPEALSSMWKRWICTMVHRLQIQVYSDHRRDGGDLQWITSKVNCDASYHDERKAGSWGVIIRDWDGDVVSVGRGKVDHLLSPFHAELIACLQDIQMVANTGAGRVVIELDAQEVVRAINSQDYDESDVGLLVDEIKTSASLNFSHFECKFH